MQIYWNERKFLNEKCNLRIRLVWDNCSLFVSQTNNLLAPLFIFNQWVNWETKRCSSYSRRLHDLHGNHLQVSFVMNYCSCT